MSTCRIRARCPNAVDKAWARALIEYVYRAAAGANAARVHWLTTLATLPL
ncbi:hypothetical protein WKR98_16965 [Pigmentiphaga sp. YJ18]|nr:hypothetical protein [Pigmentiphaga sp. H8]